MNPEIRPHGGKVILLLGILGLICAFCLVPVAPVAWWLGSRELVGMQQGRIDPAGRDQVRISRGLGITGSILWIGVAGWVAFRTLLRFQH